MSSQKDKKLIEALAAKVKKLLLNEPTSHDWWHIWRVWKMAAKLAKAEGADQTICELGALLHDVGHVRKGKPTFKDYVNHPSRSVQMAKKMLKDLGAPGRLVGKVVGSIEKTSFRFSRGLKSQTKSLEWKVVSDADKLDIIGAIGLARVFTFGGYHGRPIYDPAKPLGQQYNHRKLADSTLHHIDEKLLKIKNVFYTKTARRLAQRRHAFTEQFVREFLREWEGE